MMMIYMDLFHIHKNLWMTLKLNESPAHSIGKQIEVYKHRFDDSDKKHGKPPIHWDLWLHHLAWTSTFQKYEWYLHDIFQFVVNKNNIFFRNSCTKHICVDTFFKVEALAPFSTKSNHFNVLKAKLGSQEIDTFFATNGWFTGVFIEEKQKMLRLKPIECHDSAWYWFL